MDLLQAFYSSPEALGFRRLPPRAAMVEGRDVEAVRRGVSDRLLLDGEWDFYTFGSPEAARQALEDVAGIRVNCVDLNVTEIRPDAAQEPPDKNG